MVRLSRKKSLSPKELTICPKKEIIITSMKSSIIYANYFNKIQGKSPTELLTVYE